MSDKNPGLVVHMLDMLEFNSKFAHDPAEYVARARAGHLRQSFMSSLEVRSFMRWACVPTYFWCFGSGFGADLSRHRKQHTKCLCSCELIRILGPQHELFEETVVQS